MPARLFLLDRDGISIQEFALGSKPTVVGRFPDCEIRIDNNTLSRRHAEFVDRGDGFTVHDLHSACGIMVNGKRDAGPVTLKSGDLVRIGTCTFRFELSPACLVIKSYDDLAYLGFRPEIVAEINAVTTSDNRLSDILRMCLADFREARCWLPEASVLDFSWYALGNNESLEIIFQLFRELQEHGRKSVLLGSPLFLKVFQRGETNAPRRLCQDLQQARALLGLPPSPQSA